MKKWIMLGIVIAALTAAPMSATATAARTTSHRIVVTCPAAPNNATAAFYTDNTAAPSGVFYVNTDTPGVWQETNGKVGLQTTARKGCWAADTEVTTAPAAPSGVPSVPGGTPTLPGAPGRVPTLPGAPGGVPTVPGGVPTIPGGVPSAPGGLPAAPGLPAVPAGVPALPAAP